MCEYKISIIVPIYNQEKYLKTAITSVVNQTFGFENIELILVDDKSTDTSKSIIENFAAKYQNIKPIYLEKNSGGAGIPKNKGIENATAPFLMFFDPDDELFDDICETLYNKIIAEDADIVSGNAIDINENIDFPYYDLVFSDTCEVVKPKKDYKDYKTFRVWGSIFSKEFILNNNISFLNTKTNEDTYFAIKSFFNANKVCYLDNYYGMIYHIGNNDSLTHTYNKTSLLSTIEAFGEIKKLLISMNVNLENDYFLKNVYSRFGEKWDVTSSEERMVFKKMVEYKNNPLITTNLKISHKIIDNLLINEKFTLLHIYHSLCSIIISSRIFRRIIYPKIFKSRKIDSNQEIYKKLKSYF